MTTPEQHPAMNSESRKRATELPTTAPITPNPAPSATDALAGSQGVEAIRAAFTVCATCRKRVSLDRPDRHACSVDLPPSLAQVDPDSFGVHDALGVLKELVALKDGPRGADYEQRKPDAWARARAVVWSPAAAVTIPKGRLAEFKRDLERTIEGRLAAGRDILASEPEPLTIADWAALAGSRAALAKSLADDTATLLAALDEARAERLCSQCGEQMACMIKIGTSDGWCSSCLDFASEGFDWLTDVAETNRAAYEHAEARATAAEAVVASVRELADEWEADGKHVGYNSLEQHENDLLAGRVVPALRAALDSGMRG